MKLSNAEVNTVAHSSEVSITKYIKSVGFGTDFINALIDPGGSDCMIKASLVPEYGFIVIRTPNVLTGFGKPGNQINSLGIIRENLTIG